MITPVGKKILNRVTITGADDDTPVQEMISIYRRFPFMEWGILLSRSHSMATSKPSARFPSFDWLRKLYNASAQEDTFLKLSGWIYRKPFPLSGHLCGEWVGELLRGHDVFARDIAPLPSMFSRFQINTHGQEYRHELDCFAYMLKTNGWAFSKQFIIQMDGVNDKVFEYIKDTPHIISAPLFDMSHGQGVAPDVWPAYPGRYCGYAGGLSPDNLDAEMEKIYAITTKDGSNGPIWIDTETGVRTDDKLDYNKVWAFLEKAEPWVIGA